MYSTVVMLENIHDKRYLDAVAYRMLFHFVREDTGIQGMVHFDPDRYAVDRRSSRSSVTLPICSDRILQVGADIRGSSAFSRSRSAPKSCWSLTASAAISLQMPRSASSSKSRYRKTPDAVAVQCGEHTLTYRELNEQANRLAWLLKEKAAARISSP
ncbi:hypothetical protein P7H20_19105 [Paenibacillus larvae]|nr:hypothetical protein [Paenibacillus larvae]MDT2276509.1 hypothetical protein [Paenibacillus larvae]